ncbi:MAG: hypothetical protein ACLTMV_07005 [Thomasclavelia spiroformis]
MDSVKFYGNVILGENVTIGDFSVIGYPKELKIIENPHFQEISINDTRIGNNCKIRSHVAINEGTELRNNIYIDEFCRIGFDCSIDCNTRILYRAFICDRVKIGSNCKIAGFVCDAAIIENNVTSMGDLVHSYTVYKLPWGINEKSPHICSNTVIGYGAKIIGGITIGENCYIASGAIVSKNIPKNSIVINTNNIIPKSKWNGRNIK